MKAYIESIPPINILKYLAGLTKSGSNFSDVLLTSRGRDAIQLAINKLEIKNNDSVLIPALTCDTVSGTFASNCNTCFYDLKKDYSIDLSELEQLLIDKSEIKLVYVIHYFGFVQKNIRNISALCKKYGVFLVEDHAHSALSTFKNDLSDLYIYSFRKLLPTADGGGVRAGKASTNIHTNFKLKDKILADLKGLLIAVKRVGSLYSKKIRSSIGGLIQNEIEKMESRKSKIEPLPVSVFGRGIITSSDIKSIRNTRRGLYLKWKELIETTPFEPIFPELEEGTVPFGFPIKLKNNREVIDHFKTFNIFLKIHWLSMPAGAKNSCPVSRYLAETSITLPIYPGLKESQMYFIKEQLLTCGIPLGISDKLV